MAGHKKKQTRIKPAALALFIVFEVGIVAVLLLLEGKDVSVLNPKGLIATEQRKLIVLSTLVMLAIGIPTLFLLYFFAWRYRETNQKATYHSKVSYGRFFNVGVWAIPTAFMLILATIMWPATHRLEPRKAIDNGKKPLTIQVIAMRWKWVFIYPEQNIATVNFIQVPTGTPVEFQLTADETPMSSFWIPHLGGQLYAMTGHTNRLNLVADADGDYHGRSAEINGEGFAGMQFTARAGSQTAFDQWVSSVQQSSRVLNKTEYQHLLEPSENVPAHDYSIVTAGLYDTVLTKYGQQHAHGGY